jgi:hypothetical protein
MAFYVANRGEVKTVEEIVMNRFSYVIKFSAFMVWLIAVFVAARWIENWRVSNNYSDLLPTAAQQVLADQPKLIIDVFALPDSPAAHLVGNFLQPLLGSLHSTEINYIDSSQNPELVQQYGIQKQGEMVVHSSDQNFQLTSLSYEAFFNGLKRLDQPQDRWIVFFDNLSSHSFSQSSNSIQNSSYSEWLSQLLAANYQAMVLTWQPQMSLPKQAQLLVMAAPASSLTDEQIQWLEVQIIQGRSVLWLTDPRYATVQPALSLLFDVMHTGAFHQDQLVIKDFPEHLINQQFDRPLDLFEVMPFETANQALWLNTNGQILASTQQLNELSDNNLNSRLMVIGDSDFLSNQYLYSGGNLEMSYRLIDWLLQHDERIDLPSIGVGNTQLHFSKIEILWFAGFMLILFPLLLMMTAGYFWRKSK